MQRGDLVQLQSRRHRLGMTGVSDIGGRGGGTTPPDFPDREKIPEIDNLMSPPDFWTFRRH